MHRRNILIVVGTLLFGYVSFGYADHHGKSMEFQSSKINQQISLLQGQGGNIAVLSGEQGLVVVDGGYRRNAEALTKALKAYGGEEKISYIINTHWHGDHTGGNEMMGHHAPIIAHDNVRKRLLTRQEITLFKMVSEPYSSHAVPSLTYSKAMNLHINDEHIQLLHLPGGHTDGDSIVYFKMANVVHLGDHFFNGIFPFVDLEHGGNVRRMAKNLRGILPSINDAVVIIPGHGPLAKKPELIAFIEMLEGSLAEVAAMKKAGLNLEAMQKQGLSDQWKAWTDGFLSTEVWISLVYGSL
ncbi:MAG: MBL fold metallo-hydrolase [Oceanococcus sp.]